MLGLKDYITESMVPIFEVEYDKQFQTTDIDEILKVIKTGKGWVNFTFETFVKLIEKVDVPIRLKEVFEKKLKSKKQFNEVVIQLEDKQFSCGIEDMKIFKSFTGKVIGGSEIVSTIIDELRDDLK